MQLCNSRDRCGSNLCRVIIDISLDTCRKLPSMGQTESTRPSLGYSTSGNKVDSRTVILYVRPLVRFQCFRLSRISGIE